MKIKSSIQSTKAEDAMILKIVSGTSSPNLNQQIRSRSVQKQNNNYQPEILAIST